MFVPAHGSSADQSSLKGTTLVISCMGMGMSPLIGMDLCLLNGGMQKLGYYKSEYVAAVLINDSLTRAGEAMGQCQMPVEFWLSADKSKTFMIMRSSVHSGKMRPFCSELTKFVEAQGFKDVAILTATGSPVGRERQSNRQIPEVFAYCNNFLWKQDPEWYNKNGIRKFGWWVEEVKKRPH